MPDPTRFDPPRWLRNAHAQSLLVGTPLRRALVRPRVREVVRRATDHELDCGDGVRLHGQLSRHEGEGRRDLALFIHGWEGNAESVYILSAAGHLFRHGFDVFRLHLRDHGPSHHLNRELFHANRLDEVIGAVGDAHRRFGRGRLLLGGFSLGGNFALRVGVHGPAAGVVPAHIAAVCPVLDPVRTLRTLETGSPIYRRYFLRKWRRSLRRKHTLFPDLLDIDVVRRSRTITELTEHFVRDHTPYPDAEAYLRGYAITGPVLADLRVPTHLFAAEDDPVIPAADLDLLSTPPHLRVVRLPHGGHCAFIDALSGPSFIDRELVRVFGPDAA